MPEHQQDWISMNTRSRKLVPTLAATLLLSACASLPAPEYARQHPANPDAIQAPAPAMSSALDNYRSAPTGQDLAGQPAGHSTEDGHEQH
jgi:hypothetical protein